MMETIILTARDIRKIVQRVGINRLMQEMIVQLTTAFETFDSETIVIPERSGFSYSLPQQGLIEWMPAMRSGQQVTNKVVGYHPANPQLHNLPTIISTVSAYDTATGHLTGLADATFLTALRTGAASAVASRVLAAQDSSVIGLIGAGAQALTQLHALTQVFEIDQVLVYDRDTAVSRGFLSRAAFMNLEIMPVGIDHLPKLIQTADIICTATSIDVGAGPAFADTDVQPWLHINAVGSDFPGKFEIPVSLLRRSLVCPDFREQAIKEGECQQLAPHEIGPTLVELLREPTLYPDAQHRLTIFDSTGWALEDQVAMQLLLDYACDFDLGTTLELECIGDDVRNPYSFVLEDVSQLISE